MLTCSLVLFFFLHQNFSFENTIKLRESSKFRTSHAIVPYVPGAPLALVSHVPRALRALVSHVPLAFRAPVPHMPRVIRAPVFDVPRALRALVSHVLRTLRSFVPHVSYVLLYLTRLVLCIFSCSRASCRTCSFAPHPSLSSGVSSLTYSYASYVS